DAQTRRGAINRAVAAQASTAATWGLGLEGGVLEIAAGDGVRELYTSAWCAVIDDSGTLGIASGANMLLPPRVAAALEAGKELGQAIDELTGQRDTHRQGGAIGVLCQGWADRQQAFEQVLTLAFARLLSPHLYAREAE
ncbi:MAG: DUF84 family protein, partial [Anaerolineae bacterium]|nr:DUF84 family protein [Anaerolineae bacterium]